MLLGEYEHTLDDKNRLTFPAKFRREFEDGCVVTKGLDGCLFAWTPDGFEEWKTTILGGLDPLAKEARTLHRHFFAGAAEAVPDKQGRVVVPGNLLDHAKLTRDVVVAGVNDHVEIWDRDAWRRAISESEGSAEDVAERLAAHRS
jgi:MraZ protein